MRVKLLLISILIGTVGCLSVSINNVWKVPKTDLQIAVEKEKSSNSRDEVLRKMVLRESHLDKTSIPLAKGSEMYSRVNVYQISENQYILRDAFDAYSLDTEAKTLAKTSPSILTATFEDTKYPKFIGAFDNNKNGAWRYIPASERAEIPLGTNKQE